MMEKRGKTQAIKNSNTHVSYHPEKYREDQLHALNKTCTLLNIVYIGQILGRVIIAYY